MSRCSVSHRRTILGCHAPDPDSNKIIGRRKTGPDRARPGQAGFTETEKGDWREEGKEVGRGTSDYSFSCSPWFAHFCSYICSRSFTVSGLYPSAESSPYSAEMPGACFLAFTLPVLPFQIDVTAVGVGRCNVGRCGVVRCGVQRLGGLYSYLP